MEEELEIILRAVDEASDTFQNINDSVTNVSDTLDNMANSASNVTGDEFEAAAGAADDLEAEVDEAAEAIDNLNNSAGDVMAAETLMAMSSGVANAMMDMANSAGNFQDSMNRATLEAEGFGISADQMKSVVTELSETTGRAGGQIRESFIRAAARGVTDMNSFKVMMEGAGAQAYLLGTDIESMGNKFSSMAQKDTLMTRALAETGITMDELGKAMGMTGATADEVKAKWQELDTNQRAAILGTAASMNEGKNANAEYKTSWAGLQEQMEIAKGRIERLAGEVLLPVLIPAMQLASGALQGLGNVISGVMGSPLGGLVSALGALGGAFIIAVTGVGALKNILGFLRIEATLTAIETTALAIAEEMQSGASFASAAANAIGAAGFGGLATAAWGAATAVWAVLAPLLPFIAIGAAVVITIYEIGKAFGWWTDVGSMLDAIWAGIQRLWSAFINHPDVQALIEGISNAWEIVSNAVMGVITSIGEFFGISEGGEFDIVRALIDAIGLAWEAITLPIRTVISLIQYFYGIGQQVASGQLDILGAVQSVWNTLTAFFSQILFQIATMILNWSNQIFSYAVSAAVRFVNGIMNNIRTLPSKILRILSLILTYIIARVNLWVMQAKRGALNLVNGVMNYLRTLPSKALSALIGVVHSITSAGAKWVSSVKNQASQVVNGAYNTLKALPGRVGSALSGVVDRIVKPFRDAYNQAKKWWNQTTSLGGGGAAGFDIEGMIEDMLNQRQGFTIQGENSLDVNIKQELSLNFDLSNVPEGTDEETILNMIRQSMTDKAVVKALVNNPDFQSLDQKIKDRIVLKNNRARGV